MKVAIFTLTRERLEYTKRAFDQLEKMAGYPYDHFVIDNGSEDGTVDWLKETHRSYKDLSFFSKNRGISVGINTAVKTIFSCNEDYDLIIKMDNDCLIKTKGIISRAVTLFDRILCVKQFGPKYILSPVVTGLVHPPKSPQHVWVGTDRIDLMPIIGGIFHVVPSVIYYKYKALENLPLAKGQDEHFCGWANSQGGLMGQVQGWEVEHMDTTVGQAAKYPEYFERKYKEESAS